MEEFTSWRALKAQLLNDLADPTLRKMSQYSLNAAGTGGSRTITYRSLSELRELVKWCDDEIAKEEGRDWASRVYAVNRGRG